MLRRCLSLRKGRVPGIRLQSTTPPPPPPSSTPPPQKPTSLTPLSRILIGTNTSRSLNRDSNVAYAGWKGIVLLGLVGLGLTYFFVREKRRIEIQREADANRGLGRPLIGGPFTLVDDNGAEFTEQNLLGRFSLIYFGFTHCPDICPDELDKMGEMLTTLLRQGVELQPIFVTCDPARDLPAVLKQYLAEFHPGLVGLTGLYEQVKAMCKKYRVYFLTPPDVQPGQDYLVDHSIFFYLMDKEGQFIDVLGRQYDAELAAAKIKEHVDAWRPAAEAAAGRKKWYGFIWD